MTATARDVLAWLPQHSIGRIFVLFQTPGRRSGIRSGG
jgi:hypothetical protein